MVFCNFFNNNGNTEDWKYYKVIRAYSENSEGFFYAFRRTTDNNPDYLISSRNSEILVSILY